MLEKQVISACLHGREHYEKIKSMVITDDFSSEGRALYRFIEENYERDDSSSAIDPDLLNTYIDTTFRGAAEQARELVLPKEEVSPDNVVELYKQIRLKSIGTTLAEALLLGREEDARELIDDYVHVQDTIHSTVHVHNTIHVQDILHTVHDEHKIPIFPPALNQKVGGGILRQGHMVVFARPEVGKTLFSMNMTAGVLAAGYRVLYVGNEDATNKMLLRLIIRITGWTRDQLEADPEGAMQLAIEKGYENLYFSALNPGTISEVDGLSSTIKPDLIVIDQLLNMEHHGLDGMQKINALSIGARRLARKHDAVVLSVTQAGDSGENRVELRMGDIHGVNTDLQAQADVIVGLGANQQMLMSGHRRGVLLKNKESADHSSLPFRFHPESLVIEDV